MKEMKNPRTKLGRLIERGLREAVSHERGEITSASVTRYRITARDAVVAPPPEYTPERVVRVRARMGLSQPVFAKALNVSDSTVRAWEQGKRSPNGPSLRLLELAEREPAFFLRTLSSTTGTGQPSNSKRNSGSHSTRARTAVARGSREVKPRGRKMGVGRRESGT